jgi:AraC-like DNA-binding protein
MDAPVFGKEGYASTHAITLVLQGMLRIENDEGLLEDVPAGTLALMPKGLYTVSDIVPKGGHFEAMMFFFEPDLVQQFLESIAFERAKEKSVALGLVSGNEDISYFAHALLRLYGGEAPVNRQLTRIKLFELLHLIHASSNGNTFAAMLANLNNRERKSLREFMLANFHKPLGIEDYAYLTGRSVSAFTRDFKSKFDGIPPKQWLIERRLEKAYSLLEKTPTGNITDVAWESGYANIPHFIKEFGKKYGITPKQLLIQNRNTALV